MCLLTFLPAGVLPDPDALLNGAYANNDGHGFAIVANGHIIVQHGMDAQTMVEAFTAARHQHPDGPALFHSRFCTHGQLSIGNCHPFPVGGDSRTVLAHNGILPAAVQPVKRDPRSDTRIAAEDFLPAFGSLRSRRTRLALQRWMTPHNKMVILTADRRYRQPAYILNEQSGIWDGGIWYSNTGYLPAPPNRSAPPDEPGWDWPPWDRLEWTSGRCDYCGEVMALTDSECRYCGWCLDCGQMPEDCGCYRPAALDRRTRTAGPA